MSCPFNNVSSNFSDVDYLTYIEATKRIDYFKKNSTSSNNFFLAVGFQSPRLPWSYPDAVAKKFYKNSSNIQVAQNLNATTKSRLEWVSKFYFFLKPKKDIHPLTHITFHALHSTAPELSSSFRFANETNAMIAKKYLLTGKWMSSDDALRLNLVTEVYSHDMFLIEALNMAETLSSFKPEAIQLSKALINRAAISNHLVNEALDREQHFTVQRMTPERGGDAKLTVKQFKDLMENTMLNNDEWPKNSKM